MSHSLASHRYAGILMGMILKSLCLRACAERLCAPLELDQWTLNALSKLLALQAQQITREGGSGGGKLHSCRTGLNSSTGRFEHACCAQ